MLIKIAAPFTVVDAKGEEMDQASMMRYLSAARPPDLVDAHHRIWGGRGAALPIRVKAVWKLAEGDFEYIDVAITELEYDVPFAVRVPEPAAAPSG